jgi:opacity protein-like surface antigen
MYKFVPVLFSSLVLIVPPVQAQTPTAQVQDPNLQTQVPILQTQNFQPVEPSASSFQLQLEPTQTLPILALQPPDSQGAIAQPLALRVRDVQPNTQAKDLKFQPQSLLAQDAPTQPQSTPTSPVKSAAIAPRDGFYFSLSGGPRFISKTTLTPVDAELTFDTGFGINAALGYRFKNNLRLEGEFSYGSNRVDELRIPEIPATVIGTRVTTVPLTLASPITIPVAVTIPGVGTIPAGTIVPAGITLNPGPPLTNATAIVVGPLTIPPGTNLSAIPGVTTTGGGTTTTPILSPTVPATTLKLDGKITTLSGLLNIYYDIPTGSRFEPYIGGGVGVSRAAADDLSATIPILNTNFDISGSTTVFVYQVRAGVAYHFDSNLSATLGYRYFNVAKQSFDADPFGDLEIKGLGVHNIELGVRYRF